MFYKLLICIVEKNFTCLRLNLLELVGKRFKNWPKMYQIRHHWQLFTLEIHEYFFLIFLFADTMKDAHDISTGETSV